MDPHPPPERFPRRFRPALLTVVLCLLAAPSLEAQLSMDELIESWQSHFNAGDYGTVAALYTADAVRYPPGQPPQDGHEAIVADMSNYADLTAELSVLGSMKSADMLTGWGTFELHARSGESDGPVQSGTWMNVSVKKDGAWKIHRDIWNLRQQP